MIAPAMRPMAEQPREQLDLRCQALERALALEGLERCHGGRAGERVAGVGMPVEERALLLAAPEKAFV